MNPEGVSITQALNQMQSWLNAGEYEKVRQGAEEILNLEPGHQRALALLKQAEEKRHSLEVEAEAQAAPLPEAAPTPQAEVTPQDFLLNLEVEKKVEPQAAFDTDEFEPKKPSKAVLLLALILPAIIVMCVGGALIWMKISKNQTEVLEEAEQIEEEVDFLGQNKERVEVLAKIDRALNEYKITNGVYPSAAQIDSALTESGHFETLPKDPRNGESDKAGKTFGYIYAVYETLEGANTEYVISAIFEDSKGFAHPWSRGGSVKNHQDFRDVNQANVTYIGAEADPRVPRVRTR